MLLRALKKNRELHSERCLRLEGGRWRHEGFKFSDGWFNGFGKRYDISDQCSTKQTQKAPVDMIEKPSKLVLK